MNNTHHHRRSIRLPHYDYSQAGLYFITLCAYQRQTLFGTITQGNMLLNDAGHAVENCWYQIPQHFPSVILDKFIVMPNHVHGIIQITTDNTIAKTALKHGTSNTVGSMVRGFKIGVTKWFRTHSDITQIWQRNYYEHIIRNEDSYNNIANYIETNPLRWQEDCYYI